MAEYGELLYTVEDRVAIITLNRPERMNAFTATMLNGWYEALVTARDDEEVGAIVVTGAGRAFCAGGDTTRLAQGSIMDRPDDNIVGNRYYLRDSVHRIPRFLATLDKPYIAAINGAAAGAGMDMASMADIRFASDRSKFRMAYGLMGLVPGDAGCYVLPRLIGIANALDLMWTARIMEAPEALAMGYVQRVIPNDQLLEESVTYARRLAYGPRVAIELIKRMTYNLLYADLNMALDYSQLAMNLAHATEDSHEGPQAFAEKREPRFQGR